MGNNDIRGDLFAARLLEADRMSTRFTVTETEAEKFSRGVVAGIIDRFGYGSLVRAAAKVEPKLSDVAIDPAEFRGCSLEDLARDCLDRRGLKSRGLLRERLFAEAFARRDTTSDFPILFENAMNKILLASYAIQPDSWSRFAAIKSVPDFRLASMYRAGSFGTLDKVNEGGEFTNKAIPDGEKLSISATTKGNIVTLTRHALLSDDLGAFVDLMAKLGRAARLSIESDVYALLSLNGGLGPTQSDSQPFFHSNRANVNSTGSAISVAGIDADASVMAAQRDPGSNEYLDLRPAVLVVARGLEGQAKVVNDAQFDPTDNKFQVPNSVRGLFRDVVGTPRITGTRRYLLADPNIAPAVAVAFIGGAQEPRVESAKGWRVDGTELKVSLDYGVAMLDPRGAVTNAGQ